MYKIAAAVIINWICYPLSAAQINCNQIAEQVAQAQEKFIISPVSSYKVIGNGRLYFYSAPSENCIIRDVFIIPGDTLIGYEGYKKWISVMYMNKAGDPYEGWVDSQRLKFNGTIAP